MFYNCFIWPLQLRKSGENLKLGLRNDGTILTALVVSIGNIRKSNGLIRVVKVIFVTKIFFRIM